MQRRSNNRFPKFTDEECITVYLFGASQGRKTRRDVYNFIRYYYHEFFPDLPSYQAFCRRLNNLFPAFQALVEAWSGMLCANLSETVEYMIDSCPIIVAKQARASSSKSAREYCRKSYNSSRKEYYYGVKIHALTIRRPGTLPILECLLISPASVFDLTAAKNLFLNFPPGRSGILLADKAYIDAGWAQELKECHGIRLLTPRKRAKGERGGSSDAYSTAVSSLRQPIESFFSWIQRKFHLQDASHIRSLAGLFFHVFATIAVSLVFKLLNY